MLIDREGNKPTRCTIFACHFHGSLLCPCEFWHNLLSSCKTSGVFFFYQLRFELRLLIEGFKCVLFRLVVNQINKWFGNPCGCLILCIWTLIGLCMLRPLRRVGRAKISLSMSLIEDFPVMAGINLFLIAFSNGSKRSDIPGIVHMTNDHLWERPCVRAA